jgi:hypothetical protein
MRPGGCGAHEVHAQLVGDLLRFDVEIVDDST